MERRLAELRQRLRKKKAALQQKDEQLVGVHGGLVRHPSASIHQTRTYSPGGLTGRGSAARRPFQGGGGGAVHPVRQPGTSRRRPSRASAQRQQPRPPEAASHSPETSLR